MANSHAINSYYQERMRLDTALGSPNGADCPFDSINAAKAFVGRCNSLRRLLRAAQPKPEDGTVYDVLRISRSGATVTIRHWRAIKHPDLIDPITGAKIPLVDIEGYLETQRPGYKTLPLLSNIEDEIAALPSDQRAAVRKELNIGDDPVDN
jgi:hypothetical protein